MLTLRDLITKAQAFAFDHPELLDTVVQVTYQGDDFTASRIVREDDVDSGEPVGICITV